MRDAGYGPRFEQAVALALRDFRPIMRKGTRVPYITHLFAVTALVGEAGGDEDQLIAAVLHDWLEDIPEAQVETLEATFGDRVARLVLALSDTTEHPKPPWRARKERYIAQLASAPAEVKLVSAADKLHNARTLVRALRAEGLPTMERFTGKVMGTLWYYHQVGEALGRGWDHWLLDELRRPSSTCTTWPRLPWVQRDWTRDSVGPPMVSDDVC